MTGGSQSVEGGAVAEPTAASAARHDAHRQELIREGVTMALYISLSLLAVMIALPSSVLSGAESPALLIAISALGLLVAHWLAFRISTRLSHGGRLEAEDLELLAAQLAGGAAVTAVAIVLVVLLGPVSGVRVAELALVAFIAYVAYTAARLVPVDRLRAIAYAGVVVVLSAAALVIKTAVGH